MLLLQFNIANLYFIVRKGSNILSLFSVSGKCVQLLRRELEVDDVSIISKYTQLISEKKYMEHGLWLC
jgi:hypothetical protein